MACSSLSAFVVVLFVAVCVCRRPCVRCRPCSLSSAFIAVHADCRPCACRVLAIAYAAVDDDVVVGVGGIPSAGVIHLFVVVVVGTLLAGPPPPPPFVLLWPRS